MRRFLFAALAVLMLLCQVGCQSVALDPTETAETGESTAPETVVTTEDGTTYTIPQGFSVGFARVDITPKVYPVPMNGSTDATSAHDKLYATCVAIADGDEVALLIHTDLKRTATNVFNATAKGIERQTGIPADHIFINSTHTHNGPEVNQSSTNLTTWLQKIYYVQMKKLALDACRDLKSAEIYGGHADTTGFAFVRRFICADGSFDGIHYNSTGSPAVRHETDADPDLQLLKIVREGEKDIVMVNWQCHAAHAASTYTTQLSADFVGVLRDGVERQMGVDFAYYTGASGNLNFTTRFSDLVAYDGYGWQDAGKGLVAKVKEAYNNVTKLETGEIRVVSGGYEGTVRTDDATRVTQARAATNASGTVQSQLLAQYGFHSKYEASSIVSRASSAGKKENIFLGAIVCGDIGFAAASYEMFDTNGIQIKQQSPLKMTFICAYTNGSNGYIPSDLAWGNGGYEVHCTRYERGTAEACVSVLLDYLTNAA